MGYSHRIALTVSHIPFQKMNSAVSDLSTLYDARDASNYFTSSPASPVTSLNMDESSKNLGDVAENQNTDEMKMPNKCQFCGIQMSTASELKDHQVNYHPGKIFTFFIRSK